MPRTNQPTEEIGKNGAEEIQTWIAERVREDSHNLVKLTDVDSLGALGSDLAPDDLETNLADMVKDDRYKDIKSVAAPTGAVYFYSETYITKNYAEILARAEADDPCATIALTVREESKIYPRPTNIELFKDRIFNIDPDEFETHIARTLERQEFNDIKLINASTVARYLYSSLYMSEDYAKSLVEWEEVEQYENP